VPPAARDAGLTAAAPATRAEGARAILLPLLGRILHHEPGRRITQIRAFDLEEDLYLEDHAFVPCRGLKPLRDRFPVVPMTMTLEMLAETGALLAPGLGLLSIAAVRARRWIALDGIDRLEVRVEAEASPGPDDRVEITARVICENEEMASAVLTFGRRYRASLDLRFSELTGTRPFPISVARLYGDGHFFHGPRFQALTAIRGLGDQGVLGEAEVRRPDGLFRSCPEPRLLLDPIVLDVAGQTIGAFLVDRDIQMLPVALDRLEIYRPAPAAGTRVPVRMEVVAYDEASRRLAAMMEIGDGEGGVWMRIEGWQDILFRGTKPLALAQGDPSRHTLARPEALPGLPEEAVATLLPRALLGEIDAERIAQFFLDAAEMDAFRALPPSVRRRREWLSGRIAAKDAARLWLQRRSGGPLLHPLEVGIRTGEHGRPEIRWDPRHGEAPAVSIAHAAGAAAAVASAAPVGLDMEADAAGENLVIEDYATPEEIERLRATGAAATDPLWRIRLWCGKEAAAKAVGTGLQGRPKAFEALALDGGESFLVAQKEPHRMIRVTTSRRDGRLFAVASTQAPVAIPS
jgi:phosphopantetheinyl transferase